MKASDNEFPSVLLDEQASAPTTPATGFWRVYAKSDGLYIVDDAGAETGPLSTGGGSGALTLIDSNVLGSTAASVTFSSIPGTYSDLQIRMVARTDDASNRITFLRFNGDTGTNYGHIRHRSLVNTSDAGSSVQSGDYTGDTSIWVGNLNGTASATGEAFPFVIDVIGYASTTFRKSVRSSGAGRNAGELQEATFGGIWANTAAITSVTLLPSTGNFITGSRFHLYGIG